jgi:ATP-binding cassette subfamily C (CFTR/MRP) protein 1
MLAAADYGYPCYSCGLVSPSVTQVASPDVDPVHYLPIADHIIAFASTGKIGGEGTFDILNESNSYIKNLGISTSGPHDLGHEVANFEEHQALHPRLHGGVVGDVTHDVERQTGDLTVYRYYLHSIGKFHSLLFTGVMCGFVVAFTFSGMCTPCNMRGLL